MIKVGLNRQGDWEPINGDIKSSSFSKEDVLRTIKDYITLIQDIKDERVSELLDLYNRYSGHCASTFYLSEQDENTLSSFADRGLFYDAAIWFCEALFIEGTRIEEKCNIDLDLNSGATVSYDRCSEPAYLNALWSVNSNCFVISDANLVDVENRANYINSSCRIFKCRNCGALDSISKDCTSADTCTRCKNRKTSVFL